MAMTKISYDGNCNESNIINLKMNDGFNYNNEKYDTFWVIWITFSNCINGHICSNILFNEFCDFQKINESKIICNNCNTNKNETIDNIFYKCCEWNINLCPLCKISNEKKMNKSHLILDYNIKRFSCNEHGERIIIVN